MEMFLLLEPLLLEVMCWSLLISLCIVDIVSIVTFIEETVEGPWGELQASRAFLMCSISCCNMCWLEQTNFALKAKVSNTLF